MNLLLQGGQQGCPAKGRAAADDAQECHNGLNSDECGRIVGGEVYDSRSRKEQNGGQSVEQGWCLPVARKQPNEFPIPNVYKEPPQLLTWFVYKADQPNRGLFLSIVS